MRKLLGVSGAEMGKLLGYYGRGYKRQTIYTWERPERGETLPARYAMTDAAREAYRQLLSDLVQAASGGRLRVYAILGKRRWSVALQAQCKCGQLFVVRRRNAARCPRCIRKGKR